MCGIAGIFDTRGQQDYPRELMQRMNDIQSHRGPDESGYHFEPGVAFAAYPGSHADGRGFVPDAIARGARQDILFVAAPDQTQFGYFRNELLNIVLTGLEGKVNMGRMLDALAHFPGTAKRREQPGGHLLPDPAATVATHHEELCHIEDAGRAREALEIRGAGRRQKLLCHGVELGFGEAGTRRGGA